MEHVAWVPPSSLSKSLPLKIFVVNNINSNDKIWCSFKNLIVKTIYATVDILLIFCVDIECCVWQCICHSLFSFVSCSVWSAAIHALTAFIKCFISSNSINSGVLLQPVLVYLSRYNFLSCIPAPFHLWLSLWFHFTFCIKS